MERSNFGSAIWITINNVRVAFMAFAAGLFFSVGTGYVLFSNGIMLGAFHHMFFQYGVMGKPCRRFGFMALLRFR
jgi:uncharacterized membrane protein SpoIIM required for sporulation